MPDHPASPAPRVGPMRVFISWSGDRSKGLAQALKDWLPLVLHYVEPWMSEASIDAGQRWGIAVAKELEASNYGIICVTRENLNAPWVLFEAGALAKSLADSQVIPLLLDLDFKDISGPLAQFQAKKAEKDGIEEVVHSINKAANHPVPEDRAKSLFDALWPQLEAKFAAIPKPTTTAKPKRPTDEVMEELVSGIRSVELRIREMTEAPRPSKHRRMMKFHPFMMHELGSMLGEKPGDQIALLVMASYFREELPWLYELAMEAYRAHRSGNSKAVAEAMRRFHRAASLIDRGPFSVEVFGVDSRALHMMLREWEHLFERSREEEPEPRAKRPPPPKLEKPKPDKPEE